MALLFLALGLLLLVVGAEALVRGASKLAALAGVSPLVIGLTVVAYGTSTPELVVSVLSGLAGQADIALGNVVGSNIFNVLFILGISALIVPLVVSQQLVRLDVPLMIAVSVLTFLVGIDGKVSRVEGLFLFAGAVAYTIFLIAHGRKEHKDIQGEYAREYGGTEGSSLRSGVLNTLLVVGGLGVLVLGSRWLVDGAVSLAHLFGVSELVIGLTIVAAGTSLPEVATSIVASLRGERDIAVGNVVGSNIFNILAVLGLSSLVAPDGITVSPAAQRFDIPVMIAVAVACLPIFFTGHVIARWEGALFMGYYAAYTVYLVLAAAQPAALPVFSLAMLWFVIPLTGLTLVIVTVRAIRGGNSLNRSGPGVDRG
jgi:cation:H+ antiporter